MAGLTTLAGSLLVLMGLYFLAAMFAVLASAPMIMHVNPRSECLLFSYQDADSLSYGNYASEYQTPKMGGLGRVSLSTSTLV